MNINDLNIEEMSDEDLELLISKASGILMENLIKKETLHL